MVCANLCGESKEGKVCPPSVLRDPFFAYDLVKDLKTSALSLSFFILFSVSLRLCVSHSTAALRLSAFASDFCPVILGGQELPKLALPEKRKLPVPKTAVIFDVDGVLIDSYQPHFEGWQQMLSELGEEFTEATFQKTFGRTNRDIFASLFPGKYTEAEVQAAADRKEALYRELIKQEFPTIEGAVELIDALTAANFSLAVGSSGPPENVAMTLECLGRADRFAARVTGADVTRGKPDPQVFLLAAEKLGVTPQDCVVFEDAPAGVAAAKAAGMACVALIGTATREELSAADLVVDRLGEATVEVVAQLS